MKKRLLFVMNNLHCGGAEKSLISLLESLDYGRYEVDLFLFAHQGIFLDSLPKPVRLLPEPVAYRYFDMPIGKAVFAALRRGHAKALLARLGVGLLFKREPNNRHAGQRAWMYIARSLDAVEKRYDAAIGFLEQNPIYFCVDKVRAAAKIGWIHSDYDKQGMAAELDQPYFERLDALVTVSEACAQVLERRFPGQKQKVKVIHNIVSPALIRALAEEPVELEGEGARIVSVGRLHPQKGFDLAVEACFLLVRAGVNLTWYVVGEGEERAALQQKIESYGLQKRFRLLGVKKNPYPYIRAADLYVQPSRVEGKSIAVDEAKLLHKPIVLTRFSTASDQIRHRVNGLIVGMDAPSLAAGIRSMLEQPETRRRFVAALAEETPGMEAELAKVYGLFERPSTRRKEGIG